MTKINQEEYEILKGLDDKWKWIAKDDNYGGFIFCFLEKPHKDIRKGGWSPDTVQYKCLWGYELLFQFIQWEDEEPYNIQELIEEYEYHNEPVKLAGALSITQAKYDKYLEEHIKELENENEEAEVKKDKDWLNNELEKVIKDVESDDISFAGKKDYDEGYIDGIRDVQSIVNQLDNQETLSEEWIERNTSPVDDEGRLYVWKRDLQNAIAPKQELPVIPRFVAEWIEENKKKNRSLVFAITHIYDENEIGKSPKFFIWMETDDNEEVFARAWLDGYTVEEEQKYIVRDNSSMPLLIKNDSGEIMSYDSQIAYNNSNGTIELTEQEIKDYDERYMAFAKPVVVCN